MIIFNQLPGTPITLKTRRCRWHPTVSPMTTKLILCWHSVFIVRYARCFTLLCLLWIYCLFWMDRRDGFYQHSPYYHYTDIIMGAMASQITSLAIVSSTAYLGADQRKHQSSASLAFVRANHRWPVNALHKWPVKRKLFQFDGVITLNWHWDNHAINNRIKLYQTRKKKKKNRERWCISFHIHYTITISLD